MIPKIIHYCWLSDDEYPESIKECLASWKEVLPDYEFRLWNRKQFDIDCTQWTKQAFEAKKYAFAADYIRLYALYNYGGIYLDSDVVVYKSFNDLLHLPYFIGEDITHCFEPAIIGSEPHQKWLKDVLDRYEGLSFVDLDGSYNMKGLPIVFHDRLTPRYQFKKVRLPLSCSDYSEGVINVFPSSFFNSRDYIGAIKTVDSYCSHNYIGSWLEPRKGIFSYVKRIVPRFVLNFMYRIMIVLLYKKNIQRIQIPY